MQYNIWTIIGIQHILKTFILKVKLIDNTLLNHSLKLFPILHFFSLFAGMTILCNFILMLTWTPACLVIYHQYCRRFSIAPLSTYSWVESSPKLFQFAQKLEGLKSKWDQIWRKFFKTLFPRFILKARYIFLVLFGGLSIGAIVVVFYYPGLKLPDKEQFQLFTASHPFETWANIISFLSNSENVFFPFEEFVSKSIYVCLLELIKAIV